MAFIPWQRFIQLKLRSTADSGRLTGVSLPALTTCLPLLAPFLTSYSPFSYFLLLLLLLLPSRILFFIPFLLVSLCFSSCFLAFSLLFFQFLSCFLLFFFFFQFFPSLSFPFLFRVQTFNTFSTSSHSISFCLSSSISFPVFLKWLFYLFFFSFLCHSSSFPIYVFTLFFPFPPFM